MNFTIGAQTRTIGDAATFSGTFSEGGNFTVFTGLSASSFTISGNPGGTAARSAINGLQIVNGDPAIPPVIVDFTADDHYVTPGTTVQLAWDVTGFDTISIDNGIGDVAGQSSTNVTVNATTTFTLTATNPDGSATATLRVGAGPPRPNILFFLVDDMGWQDTSEPFLYDGSGNEVVTALNNRYRTPGMEVLADRGMKFTNAYAMPVCTPSRTCWMTGLNSARHRVTNWVNPSGTDNDQNSTTSHNSPGGWVSGGLPEGHPTLPALLQGVGYRTIHAGKAHFGATAYARDPLNIGFDVNIAGSEIGHPGSYSGDYGQGSNRPVPDLEDYHNTGTHLSEALTLEMNKAIEDAVGDGSPFFAYMAHYAVHSPFQTDPRFSANYPGLSGGLLAYATLLEGMDKSLGDILAKLEALGVAEDTLVVFMSDNGGDAPFPSVNDSNAPLRHKKGSRYEGGVREPFIVSWAKPDAANAFQAGLPIPAGSHEDDIIAIFDLFPTFASVAGAPFGHPVDGRDLTPYFRAEPGTHRPQKLLIHFPHDHRSDYFTIFREGDWKLIYNFAPDSYELYNLATDLSETTNLAAAEPERVMAMARAMARELEAAGAQWPTLQPGGADDPFAMPQLPGVDLDHDGLPDNTEDP
ncbi:MAG: sulfatase, partial [Akkermansiaceae bacterium]|nr:sulfatase [Akkermansiaceae bacterium]